MRISSKEVKEIAHALGLAGKVVIRLGEPPSNQVAATGVFAHINSLIFSSETVKLAGCPPRHIIERISEAFTRVVPVEQRRPLALATLKFNVAPTITEEAFIARIQALRHGEYYTVATGWDAHAISLTFIRDDIHLHLLLLNKGKPVTDAQQVDVFLKLTCQVYSFAVSTDSAVISAPFLSKIYQTCIGKVTNGMAQYCKSCCGYGNDYDYEYVREGFYSLLTSPELVAARNTDLSNKLRKSLQKVGNCTRANLNIVWHFALISQQMQADESLTFEAAYARTLPEYKRLRQKERWLMLRQLLLSRNDFIAGWEAMTLQAICKLLYKEQKASCKLLYEELKTTSNNNADPVKCMTESALEVSYSLDHFIDWLGAQPNADLVLEGLGYLMGREADGMVTKAKVFNQQKERLSADISQLKEDMNALHTCDLCGRYALSCALAEKEQSLEEHKQWWNDDFSWVGAGARMRQLQSNIATKLQSAINPLGTQAATLKANQRK